VTLALTLGTWSWEWRLSREWGSISELYDATASGFLTGDTDEEHMARIIADPEFRGRILTYMRDRRLSIFAEPRAAWLQHAAPENTCVGTITSAAPLASGGYRIRGTVPARGRRDLVFLDRAGIIKGLARTLPIQSEFSPANEFLGYLDGLAPADTCPIEMR
jgi:hypothetical protein